MKTDVWEVEYTWHWSDRPGGCSSHGPFRLESDAVAYCEKQRRNDALVEAPYSPQKNYRIYQCQQDVVFLIRSTFDNTIIGVCDSYVGADTWCSKAAQGSEGFVEKYWTIDIQRVYTETEV